MTIPSPEYVRDPQRLARLRETGLLDTPPEESFDRLGRLAIRLLRAPVALMALVDADRLFFKSSIGLPERWAGRRETPLAHSFCQFCVETGAPFVMEDARRDEILRESPAVSDLGVIAYAGVPLVTVDGARLGSVCVIDWVPRRWTDEDVHLLTDLAALAVTEIELRMLRRRGPAPPMQPEDAGRGERRHITTIAHELRQPLSAMSVAVPLLGHPDSHVRGRAARILERQIGHLNRLVEDLLDIARLEARRVTMLKGRLNLCDLVTEAADTLGPIITKANRILTVSVPREPVIVEADGARLFQVLTNLLHNAEKFTESGDVISVTVVRSGTDAVIRVQDTGRGMTRDLLARLFEPFTQARTGEYGGLGLGLAVARGIVELHGGTIEARSHGPGQGSEFVVTLRVAAG